MSSVIYCLDVVALNKRAAKGGKYLIRGVVLNRTFSSEDEMKYNSHNIFPKRFMQIF